MNSGVLHNTVSLLIFTKDDLWKICNSFGYYLNYVDEIVVVDSTRPENEPKCFEIMKNEKIKVYKAPAFGFVEPLRVFGIGKCQSDFILNIDADELISEDLLQDLKKIISNNSANRYSILRINKYEDGTVFNKEYISNRLFRKGTLSYKGYIHEPPLTSFKAKKLDKKYYITNVRKEMNFYALKASMFVDRMSFPDLVESLKEYYGTFVELFISFILSIEIKLRKKEENKELSKFEYHLFTIILFFLATIKNVIFIRTRNYYHFYRYLWKKYDNFFSVDKVTAEYQYKISRLVRGSGGVINFLQLDKDETILELYNRFLQSNLEGEDFFIKILKERAALLGIRGEHSAN